MGVKARIIPNENSIGHLEMLYNPSDYDLIYGKVSRMTDGDHEIAADAASWCELATLGEIYEFREGIIMIEDVA